jgi:hypothetical protein
MDRLRKAESGNAFMKHSAKRSITMTDKMVRRIYKKFPGKIDRYQAEKMADLLLFAVIVTGLVSFLGV